MWCESNLVRQSISLAIPNTTKLQLPNMASREAPGNGGRVYKGFVLVGGESWKAFLGQRKAHSVKGPQWCSTRLAGMDDVTGWVGIRHHKRAL